MSQFNLDTPLNPYTKTGAVLASDLSSWRDSIHSTRSGTTTPSYAQTGTMWVDTTTNPWVLKMYDGANDIVIGTLNTTTDKFIPGVDAVTLFNDIKQAGSVTTTGVVELATLAETIAGTVGDKVVTSQGLASGLTLTTNGEWEFPGGFILKWGYGYISGQQFLSPASAAITFGTSFPTLCGAVVTTPIGTSGAGKSDFWGVTNLSTTGFTQWSLYDDPHNFYYMAVGY